MELKRLQKSSLILAVWVATCCGIAGLACFWSYGYVIHRPSLDSRVTTPDRLVSVTPFKTITRPDGSHHIVPDEQVLSQGLESRLNEARRDPYYDLDTRLLLHLERDGHHVTSSATASIPDDLYGLLRTTGTLRPVWGERASYGKLQGLFIEVEQDGNTYAVVAAYGEQIANDTYPYYEFVFEQQRGGLALRSTRQFTYEIAGIEGYEGWPAYLLFLIVLLIATSPAAFFIAARKSVSVTAQSVHRPDRFSDAVGQSPIN